jgi:hypothetical protein
MRRIHLPGRQAEGRKTKGPRGKASEWEETKGREGMIAATRESKRRGGKPRSHEGKHAEGRERWRPQGKASGGEITRWAGVASLYRVDAPNAPLLVLSRRIHLPGRRISKREHRWLFCVVVEIGVDMSDPAVLPPTITISCQKYICLHRIIIPSGCAESASSSEYNIWLPGGPGRLLKCEHCWLFCVVDIEVLSLILSPAHERNLAITRGAGVASLHRVDAPKAPVLSIRRIHLACRRISKCEHY